MLDKHVLRNIVYTLIGWIIISRKLYGLIESCISDAIENVLKVTSDSESQSDFAIFFHVLPSICRKRLSNWYISDFENVLWALNGWIMYLGSHLVILKKCLQANSKSKCFCQMSPFLWYSFIYSKARVFAFVTLYVDFSPNLANLTNISPNISKFTDMLPRL